MNRWNTDDFWGRETTLYDTVMVEIYIYIYLSKPVAFTPRATLNVNFRLWVLVMCQGRFINYNKSTTLPWDVDGKGGYACVGERGR